MYALRIFYKSCTPSTQASFPESPPSLIKTNKASQTFTRWTVSFSDPRSSTHLSSLHLGADRVCIRYPRGGTCVSHSKHLYKRASTPEQVARLPAASRAWLSWSFEQSITSTPPQTCPLASVATCFSRGVTKLCRKSRLPESGAAQSNVVIVHDTHDASQPA